MPQSKFIWALLGVVFFISSCIKDEAKNMEADITQVSIADSLINVKPIINNRNVVIYVKPGKVDLKEFALDFDLTPGATSVPASGSVQDFSAPVFYEVTSEDGQYKKQYSVTLLESSVPEMFDFELFKHDEKKNWIYFYEEVEGVQQELWASGNSGFALTAGSNPTEKAYPTQATDDPKLVKSGKYAAYLETKSTGFLGSLVKKPIAAGNLFIGSMFTKSIIDIQTRFGLPFNKIPVSMTGYYKYEPGKKVIDMNGKEVNVTDECDIYAVLFDRVALMQATANDKEDAGRTWLNDKDVLTSPHIIALAQLKETSATKGDGLVKFDLPFVFKKEYSQLDADAYRYSIAVVLSSSKNGAIFQGAVGSKLIVDEVKINVR
ncbi:PCMD domain-containing protein [Sphingobacterium mizutaii]|uniref:PCMD domain-containing protein n=1 Tax=Sphingobacterium mizutaii TaxID=1010 RepID=UPI0016244AAA|nr:PCMD domain-containing protein [Sphingobacterium mizutaii]